jgi:hypothetical protein
MQGFKGPI